ncbi:MAG: hypothetical protein HS128_01855 [Ideonella sp.]|nr:hypothetical protein [Ideonella sp.]MCC7458484.1 hypothetical protein [Nitrospira sp.]
MNAAAVRPLLLPLIVAAAWAGASAARAESFASSASSAASQSVGSLSESIQNSSQGSSRATRTADCDYRVIEVAEVAEVAGRAGLLRLTLRATAAPDDEAAGFMLTLPRQALGARGVAVGDVIHASNRPYGIEFARAATVGAPREPFFLALRDDWRRELDAHPVSL